MLCKSMRVYSEIGRMKLLNIQTLNLFGISQAVVEFQDGMAILVGPNGSGKSSILRVVDFFLRHYTSGQWDKPPVQLERGQKLDANKESSIRLDFELNETEAGLFQYWRVLGLMQYLANNTKMNDYLLGFRKPGDTCTSLKQPRDKAFESAEELRVYWTQIAKDFEKVAYKDLEQGKKRYGRVSISAKTCAADHSLLDIGHPLLLAPITDHSEETLLYKELQAFKDTIIEGMQMNDESAKALKCEFQAKLLQYSMPALTGKSVGGVTDAFQNTALEINRGWDYLRGEYETREGYKPPWIRSSDFNTIMRLLIYNSVVSLPQDRGLLSTLPSQTNRYQGGTQLVLKNAMHLACARFHSMDKTDQKKVEKFKEACRDLFGEGFDVRPVYSVAKVSDSDPDGPSSSRPTQFTTIAVLDQRSMTPLEDTSGGQIEAFLVLTAVIFSNADTVLLDEPGYSLHPPMQAKLRRWMLKCLKKAGHHIKSILIVTHSVEMFSEETFYGIHHFMRKQKGKHYPSVVKNFSLREDSAEDAQHQMSREIVPAKAPSIKPRASTLSPRATNKFAVLRQLSSTARDEMDDEDVEETPADDLEPTTEVFELKEERSRRTTEAKQARSRARGLVFYDFQKEFTRKNLVQIIGKHTGFQNSDDNRLSSVSSVKHLDLNHIKVVFDDPRLANSVLESTKLDRQFKVRPEKPRTWSSLRTPIVADILDPNPQKIYLNTQDKLFLLSPERRRLLFSTSAVFVEGVNDKRFLEAVLYHTSKSDVMARGKQRGIAWEPIVIDGCTAGARALRVARDLGIPHTSLFDRDVVLQPKYVKDPETTTCRKVLKASQLYKSQLLTKDEKQDVVSTLPGDRYSEDPEDLRKCYVLLQEKHNILIWEEGDLEGVVLSVKETRDIVEREFRKNSRQQHNDSARGETKTADWLRHLKSAAAKLHDKLEHPIKDSAELEKIISTVAEVKSFGDKLKVN